MTTVRLLVLFPIGQAQQNGICRISNTSSILVPGSHDPLQWWLYLTKIIRDIRACSQARQMNKLHGQTSSGLYLSSEIVKHATVEDGARVAKRRSCEASMNLRVLAL